MRRSLTKVAALDDKQAAMQNVENIENAPNIMPLSAATKASVVIGSNTTISSTNPVSCSTNGNSNGNVKGNGNGSVGTASSSGVPLTAKPTVQKEPKRSELDIIE